MYNPQRVHSIIKIGLTTRYTRRLICELSRPLKRKYPWSEFAGCLYPMGDNT